jgi:hypothetical protein
MTIESDDWTWADGLTLAEAVGQLFTARWDRLHYSWRNGTPHVDRIDGMAGGVELAKYAKGVSWISRVDGDDQLLWLFDELADPDGVLSTAASRWTAQGIEDAVCAIPYAFWRSADEIVITRGQLELAGVRYLDPRLSLRAGPHERAAIVPKADKRRPGPKTGGDKRMLDACRALAAQQFKTVKEEHAAVLKHIGINGAAPRGLTYSNFLAMKRKNVKSQNL